jgi:hypothetical protein
MGNSSRSSRSSKDISFVDGVHGAEGETCERMVFGNVGCDVSQYDQNLAKCHLPCTYRVSRAEFPGFIGWINVPRKEPLLVGRWKCPILK